MIQWTGEGRGMSTTAEWSMRWSRRKEAPSLCWLFLNVCVCLSSLPIVLWNISVWSFAYSSPTVLHPLLIGIVQMMLIFTSPTAASFLSYSGELAVEVGLDFCFCSHGFRESWLLDGEHDVQLQSDQSSIQTVQKQPSYKENCLTWHCFAPVS